MGRTLPEENMMAKYLLLKHYRGAPEAVNDVPMEKWTPTEIEDHVRYMNDFARRLEGTGEYVDTKEPGVYRCAGCQAELFRSDDKFDSRSGWPSFTDPALADAVELRQDTSHGMVRTEAVCAKCGGHLGHVFDDGPRDRGGMRYCINSCVMQLDSAAGDAA